MPQKVYGFTKKVNGLLNVIKTQVVVSQAFDPHNTKEEPPLKEFQGIWDTGATHSVITQKVVDECALKPIGVTQVYHAGGKELCERYLVNITLPNNVVVYQIGVTKAKFSGSDVLIGMDIINKGDFVITNFDGNTTFSFRIPSLECIDFRDSELYTLRTSTQQPAKKVGRNSPCSCGSGKKYKNCCGK